MNFTTATYIFQSPTSYQNKSFASSYTLKYDISIKHFSKSDRNMTPFFQNREIQNRTFAMAF